jgi:hypothetical protein
MPVLPGRFLRPLRSGIAGKRRLEETCDGNQSATGVMEERHLAGEPLSVARVGRWRPVFHTYGTPRRRLIESVIACQ